MANLNKGEEGDNAFTLIDDTDTHNFETENGYKGFWMSVEAVNNANAVINSTNTQVEGSVDFDVNVTLIPGQKLKGKFTAIDLVSGAVVAYIGR